MKRIILTAALLGVSYFANAQVGIGTPTPAAASQLDVVAEDKGVLIPRVELRSIDEFSPIQGTKVNSLLVYNTITAGSADKVVIPGFYYWFNDRWERIVNQTQLNDAIDNVEDLQGDVNNIINLLKVAFPSNNLVDPSVDGDTHGGGMVFIPGDGSTTSKIQYVYFDGENYVTKDITAEIEAIIQGAESKTTIIESPADSGKYYYISEETIAANNNQVPSSPFEDDGTTLRAGVVLIDVPTSVVNNFETILDGTTTIVKPGTTEEYYTVEEIIKLIASEVDGNVIYKNIGDETNPNWVFQYYNVDTEEYDDISFDDLVKANETRTSLARSENGAAYAEVTTDPKEATKVTYEYSPEKGNKNYIDVTADVKYSIENNEDVKNAITDVLNQLLTQGGNVYYTKDKIENSDNEGVEVPANSLFTIEIVNGEEVKMPIDISGSVIEAITNNSQTIKNILGDQINSTTVVKTGDTYNGKDVYVYANETSIAANSAETSGVSIPGDIVPGAVIGIKVIDGKGISSNVTDIVISGQDINFNIGTGNMYNILGAGTYQVIVEFTE